MWNPDKSDKEAIPITKPTPQLSDEYIIFRRYMMESTYIREAYGLGRNREGYFWIEDLEKGMKMEGKYKAMLKQFCEEMKGMGKWIKKPESKSSTPGSL